MRLRRRTLLAGTGPLAGPLSGYLGWVPGRRPAVDVVLRNYTADRQPLQVELLRDVGNDVADARVLRREFEIPPASDGEPAGVVREPDVVPQRRYVVRVRLKFGRGDWRHRHFFPTGSGAAKIAINVHRDGDTGALYTRFY